jgi:protein BCP1
MIKQPRVVPLETPDNSSDSSDSENEEGKEIQVEFEARSPEGEDYQGIKRLLQQLFLRSQVVDCSRVTDTILAQRGIGSVIKQSVPDEADDANEESNEVYAISTVLNLADKTKDSVIGLRRFLLEQTAKGNDRQVLKYVTDLLNGKVGFLINERFINIPAQITVPLLETLVLEMRKARDRNLPYDFEHYIIICKLYKPKNLAGATANDQACIFSNPEEELFVGESELCIDYDVSNETNLDNSTSWTDGVEMTPWRRIVVFKADKLDSLIRSVRDSFPHSAQTH